MAASTASSRISASRSPRDHAVAGALRGHADAAVLDSFTSRATF